MNSKLNDDIKEKTPNCVRLCNIKKNVDRYNNMQRHLDNVLYQISKFVGEFNYVFIYRCARAEKPHETDTIGHLQLKDNTKHRELAYRLNEYPFHGYKLVASIAYHHFASIDDEYYIRPVNCTECNDYSRWFRRHEEQVIEDAIEAKMKSIQVKRCNINKVNVDIKDDVENSQVCRSSINSDNIKNKDDIKRSDIVHSNDSSTLSKAPNKVDMSTSTMSLASSICVIREPNDTEEFEYVEEE